MLQTLKKEQVLSSSMVKFLFFFVLFAGIAFNPLTAPHAEAATPKKQVVVKKVVLSRIDSWGFARGYCTSYVATRLNAMGISFYNGMKGPNGRAGWFGNAYNWDNNARKIGLAVDKSPRVGDIAVWESRSKGVSASGHVAFVESVNPDGTVNISENNGGGRYKYRTNVRADHYIHMR